MSYVISLIFALLVGLIFQQVFRRIDPTQIKDYRHCKGGWWEAELNDCHIGLLMVPQQPINTYTNLAFAAGGLFVAISVNTPPSYVFTLTCLYLCLGSSLYHATSTRWAGSLDVSSMYAAYSALAAYSVCTFFDCAAWLTAGIMLASACAMGYLLRYKYHGDMSLKIGVFVAFTYAFAILSYRESYNSTAKAYLIASFVIFAAAFAVWVMDKKRFFPLKRWGHGVWHLLTATATCLVFYAVHLTD